MRSEGEMLDLILRFAEQDDNIVAVSMNGSRANADCTVDEFSDFDIQYLVHDVSRYVSDRGWMGPFGEPLIIQEPDDWFSHRYDVASQDNYAFLMQFVDGNRIDLTFVSLGNVAAFRGEGEARKILLNKDPGLDLRAVAGSDVWKLARPTEKEFADTVNEFLWLSLYVWKGILRDEVPYAMSFYHVQEMDLFYRVLSWKIGVDKGFDISLGKSYKYLKRFVNKEEMERIANLYPRGTLYSMYKALLDLVGLFAFYAQGAAEGLGYTIDMAQIERVLGYLRSRGPDPELD